MSRRHSDVAWFPRPANDTAMRRPLFQLSPGTRFLQPDLGITGTLVMVNECRARVRLDQPVEEVEFTGPDGRPRSFRASRTQRNVLGLDRGGRGPFC